MAHGDAVVHHDGVELTTDAPGSRNLLGYQRTHVLRMHVAGHELGVAVGDGDDGLPKSSSVMPVASHRARAPADSSVSTGSGSKLRHAFEVTSALRSGFSNGAAAPSDSNRQVMLARARMRYGDELTAKVWPHEPLVEV